MQEPLSDRLDPAGPGGRMTVSLGIACVTAGDATSFAQGLELADAALYESKTSGRDRITLRHGRV